MTNPPLFSTTLASDPLLERALGVRLLPTFRDAGLAFAPPPLLFIDLVGDACARVLHADPDVRLPDDALNPYLKDAFSTLVRAAVRVSMGKEEAMVEKSLQHAPIPAAAVNDFKARLHFLFWFPADVSTVTLDRATQAACDVLLSDAFSVAQRTRGGIEILVLRQASLAYGARVGAQRRAVLLQDLQRLVEDDDQAL